MARFLSRFSRTRQKFCRVLSWFVRELIRIMQISLVKTSSYNISTLMIGSITSRCFGKWTRAPSPGLLLPYKTDGGARRKFSKTPLKSLKGTKFSFWGRGSEFITPLRSTNSEIKKSIASGIIFFQVNNWEIKVICVTITAIYGFRHFFNASSGRYLFTNLTS